MRHDTDVLIVGGGITGLSLASYLRGRDYLVLEKAPIVGGYCGTTLRNGFVWDHSGHFFHFKHADIKDYLLERIDCEIVTVNKISNINYKGHIIDFPFQHNIHQLPVDEFVECLDDAYRCSGERKDHSSFKKYVRSALGDADRNAPRWMVMFSQPPTCRSVVTALAAAGAFGLLPTNLPAAQGLRSANSRFMSRKRG